MTTTFTIEPEVRREIARQIGTMNVLSISGGRIVPIDDGIELPVSNGYHVRIQLTPVDDYTVTRIFRRSGKDTIHGQATGVYADQVASFAYYAGMFRSYEASEWITKAVTA